MSSDHDYDGHGGCAPDCRLCRAQQAEADNARLQAALEELQDCCNPPGVPNIVVVRAILDAALARTEAL